MMCDFEYTIYVKLEVVTNKPAAQSGCNYAKATVTKKICPNFT